MSPLTDLVGGSHVVVCCGTGGVGKTTTAAALGLTAARQGRDAVVVTIDPAKRLADTLGLAGLGDTPTEIPRPRWDPSGRSPGGRLSALMLDTRATFDGLVRRYAGDDAQAERILENRFYRNIAGALSGTQEYMAMEKLHELHEEGGYDLIVVDTPPSRHALDFLDAPQRLVRLLDNRVFRFLMMPAGYLRMASNAAQRFLRSVAKVIGAEVLDDIVTFFRAFEGMEQGFRERAARVDELMADATTTFVLITSPRRDAVDEAEFFADRLRAADLRVGALVVNRVHPDFESPLPADALRAEGQQLGGRDDPPARRLAARFRNLADYVALSRRERDQLADVGERIGASAVAYVPSLPGDAVDVAALDEIAAHLLAAEPARSRGRGPGPAAG